MASQLRYDPFANIPAVMEEPKETDAPPAVPQNEAARPRITRAAEQGAPPAPNGFMGMDVAKTSLIASLVVAIGIAVFF